jgi:hypothetical protein
MWVLSGVFWGIGVHEVEDDGLVWVKGTEATSLGLGELPPLAKGAGGVVLAAAVAGSFSVFLGGHRQSFTLMHVPQAMASLPIR